MQNQVILSENLPYIAIYEIMCGCKLMAVIPNQERCFLRKYIRKKSPKVSDGDWVEEIQDDIVDTLYWFGKNGI